ncbi:hypothetical protein F4776DRAFT_673977 [Hypoxylon sp. NC0597]|nr:hypothetical protein F4776DRAFT_673977 [Hypoxylon sp. NC0597]
MLAPVPDPLGREEGKEYIEKNKEHLKVYLSARIDYLEDIGYFFNAFGHNEVYLVLILAEDCPHRPNPFSRNYNLDVIIVKAMTDNRPLPDEPHHTLYTMFSNYVVVRRDGSAESGYSIVSWSPWIKTPGGEYGGQKVEIEDKRG